MLHGRAIIRADRCLLFEPNSACSRKFLDIVCQRLQDHEAARSMRGRNHNGAQDIIFPQDEENPPPFELEILEAALMVATGASAYLAWSASRYRALPGILPCPCVPLTGAAVICTAAGVLP